MWANRTGDYSFICSFLALREQLTNRLKIFIFIFFLDRAQILNVCVGGKTLKVVTGDFLRPLPKAVCPRVFLEGRSVITAGLNQCL